MMFTIDRINKIIEYFQGNPLPPSALMPVYKGPPGNSGPMVDLTPGHTILDAIDKRVGIITRMKWVPFSNVKCWVPALLGERLRRLERHVFMTDAPRYFHLGAEAEAT